MDIDGYIPTNFDQDKMNAFKFLYLYRRKQEIFHELLRQVDLTDPEDFLKKRPIIKSYEYLQQECGMTDEDLSLALSIGLWVDEYDQMINMDHEERQEFINKLEEDIEIPEELYDELRELHSGIDEIIARKQKEQTIFNEILHENYNNQEEWPNGFSPYS